LLVLLLLLAACARGPSDAAMSQAIGDHVVRAEDYPAQFVHAENFVFRNPQRVPDTDPAQFAVESDFEIAYTADGATIVADLREQSRAEREKARRRTNSVVERITSVLGDALATAADEQRFADVRVGDRDRYSGRFVLARNADGSWRVEGADYR
jgi:hypothetical protein